jgi:hypothetical protein
MHSVIGTNQGFFSQPLTSTANDQFYRHLWPRLCTLTAVFAGRSSIALVFQGWKYCRPPGIIELVLVYIPYRAPKFSKILGLLTCLLFSRQELFAFHCLVSTSLPITPGLSSPHELVLESLTKVLREADIAFLPVYEMWERIAVSPFLKIQLKEKELI